MKNTRKYKLYLRNLKGNTKVKVCTQDKSCVLCKEAAETINHLKYVQKCSMKIKRTLKKYWTTTEAKGCD